MLFAPWDTSSIWKGLGSQTNKQTCEAYHFHKRVTGILVGHDLMRSEATSASCGEDIRALEIPQSFNLRA
jgi:hypothetical protein